MFASSVTLDASPMSIFKKKKKDRSYRVENKVKLHPQNKKAIELAFIADGQTFYKFKSFADLPQIRQTMGLQFLGETGQVMDGETLKACLENLADLFTRKTGTTQSEVSQDFYKQIGIMRDMANSLNYVDAFYHVASAITFTLEEDINNYDPLIAGISISKMKKLEHGFFLKTLAESFPSMGIQLPKDLEKSLIAQRIKLSAHLQALHTLGVELPMSESLKSYSSGQAETS